MKALSLYKNLASTHLAVTKFFPKND